MISRIAKAVLQNILQSNIRVSSALHFFTPPQAQKLFIPLWTRKPRMRHTLEVGKNGVNLTIPIDFNTVVKLYNKGGITLNSGGLSPYDWGLHESQKT